jgi:hypothetical protein
MKIKEHSFKKDRYLNRAQWREVRNAPLYYIEADFSEHEQHRGHETFNGVFAGAKTNLMRFATSGEPNRMIVGDVNLVENKRNGIVFDEAHWKIRIIGTANAQTFNNWIAKTDPMLSEHFVKQGFRYAAKAFERNSAKLAAEEKIKAAAALKPKPSRPESSGYLFDMHPLAFDVHKHERGKGKGR